MSFELTVEMVGLCLFVPDKDAGVVYVPMPAADPAHGIEQHVARLCFDTAYLRPNAVKLDGLTTLLPLDRTALDLASTTPLDPTVPFGIVDVGAVAKRNVIPDALQGDDPDMLLAARAVVRSGKVTGLESGACWAYPNSAIKRHLSNRLTWTVGQVEGDQLDLALTPLAGALAQVMPPLYPLGGQIALALYYTTRDELPPQPAQPGPPPAGTPAHHFSAFYTLFEKPVIDDPLPIYVGLTCGDVEGGSPYTCMAGQSDPTNP